MEYRARWPTKAARTEAWATWEEFNRELAFAEVAAACSSSGASNSSLDRRLEHAAEVKAASSIEGDQARQPSTPAAAATPAWRLSPLTLPPPPRDKVHVSSSRDAHGRPPGRAAAGTPSVPAAAASDTLRAAPNAPKLPPSSKQQA